MIKPLENVPIRFFIWDAEADDGHGDIVEVCEADFIAAEGEIDYERHTMYLNGVNQICLTKEVRD